ncbi:MAG: FAD:protein FMN transferase [Coriobacteriaceae bacterium]|nr:FAD:protein FMN transferase [Coriobacteriaceae bacterium]
MKHPEGTVAHAPMTRRRFTRLAGIAGLSCMVPALAGCAGRSPSSPNVAESSSAAASDGDAAEDALLSRTLFAFDTVLTLKAACDEATMDALCDRCEYFESIFSRTIETSDIGRVNAAGGASVEVAPETADLVGKALHYCEESGGRFDISIGAVSTLWDFKAGVVPAEDAIREAVKHVDYRNVQVDGTTVTLLDPDAKLDLGGIAKGYIADDLCRMLADAGCASGFVNLGGNVKTVGCRPDGKPWHVGIQDPNDVNQAVVAAVYSEGTSAVTSGLYERQFEQGGRRYWHILDPKTGYPVETDLVSATIFSSASIDGDGYTKPLFMMGCDEALAWIEAKDGIEGLLVDAEGNVVQTSGCDAELL